MKKYKKIQDWALPKGVSALISQAVDVCAANPYGTFNLALHVGDNAHKVRRNRQQLLGAEPSLRAIQWLNQTHSSEVVLASGNCVTPFADACISRTLGLGAAVLTADCLPVLFCDAKGIQVGAAHAGWRGLAQGILLNTLAYFAKPQEVSVYFAPAISQAAFAIGKEVRHAFYWATDACFYQAANGQLYANLYALAKEQLTRAGVQQFYGGTGCTYQQPEYYSYRQKQQTGRQVSLIWRDK